MSNVPETLGTSIRLYLADGRADGFRLVEKSNWTGLGLVSSRSDYPRARKRAEYGRPGVYLLTGPPSGNALKDQLYIGEADDVRERVDQHLKGKDFWTTVIAFTSKDENLNKAHVRYLEARLVQLATKAGRVGVLNGNAPAPPKLSEPDRADMEAYLREMLVILPVLGVVALEAIEAQAPESARLYLKGKNAQATGADTLEGFVVEAGSLARLASVPSIHTWLDASSAAPGGRRARPGWQPPKVHPRPSLRLAVDRSRGCAWSLCQWPRRVEEQIRSDSQRNAGSSPARDSPTERYRVNASRAPLWPGSIRDMTAEPPQR
jgi:hypothetical protein